MKYPNKTPKSETTSSITRDPWRKRAGNLVLDATQSGLNVAGRFSIGTLELTSFLLAIPAARASRAHSGNLIERGLKGYWDVFGEIIGEAGYLWEKYAVNNGAKAAEWSNYLATNAADSAVGAEANIRGDLTTSLYSAGATVLFGMMVPMISYKVRKSSRKRKEKGREAEKSLERLAAIEEVEKVSGAASRPAFAATTEAEVSAVVPNEAAAEAAAPGLVPVVEPAPTKT